MSKIQFYKKHLNWIEILIKQSCSKLSVESGGVVKMIKFDFSQRRSNSKIMGLKTNTCKKTEYSIEYAVDRHGTAFGSVPEYEEAFITKGQILRLLNYSIIHSRLDIQHTN